MDDLVLVHKAGGTLDLSRATIYSTLQMEKFIILINSSYTKRVN